MRALVKAVDTLSRWTGSSIRWLAMLLVAQISFEVIMRFVFDKPTIWGYETSMMIGGAMYVLAFSYATLKGSHVRIDVFYRSMKPRTQALVDVIGALICFFPLMIMLTVFSTTAAMKAWRIHETSIESTWFPPLAPFRTVVVVGFVLVTLQGLAQFVRDIYMLTRNKAYDRD